MFHEVKVDFRSLQSQFREDITELGICAKPWPEYTFSVFQVKFIFNL
jgi:hypothetical protein